MIQNPETKPVIAVDIDEVVFPMVDDLIAYIEKEHSVRITPEEFKTYRLEDIWPGGPVEGANVFQAYASQYGIEVAPIKGAAEALGKLSLKHDIIVMTSRDIVAEEKTRNWLGRHFPEVFKNVHMLGNKYDSVTYREKAEVCKELGVYCLIDDSLRPVLETNDAGVKALLFGDYSWNQAEKLPDGVTRVKNWQEVLEYFDGTGK
jgi:5'(3')-deoxyribonucleotidase